MSTHIYKIPYYNARRQHESERVYKIGDDDDDDAATSIPHYMYKMYVLLCERIKS